MYYCCCNCGKDVMQIGTASGKGGSSKEREGGVGQEAEARGQVLVAW